MKNIPVDTLLDQSWATPLNALSGPQAVANRVESVLEKGILTSEQRNDPNVRKYLGLLSEVFMKAPVDFSKIQTLMYEFLTVRPDMEEFLPLFQEGKVRAQSQWYEWSIRETEKYAKNHDMEIRDTNPQWFQINVIPKSEHKSISYKTYTTFRFQDYAFIRYLPGLANDLQALALSSGDPISCKVNNSLGGFARSSDSLVIHCTKETTIPLVQAILKAWKKKYELRSVPRYLERSEVAIDGRHEIGGKKLSFSELAAVQSAEYARVLADRHTAPARSSEAVMAAAIMWAKKRPAVKV